jgi:hypothetical protein
MTDSMNENVTSLEGLRENLWQAVREGEAQLAADLVTQITRDPEQQDLELNSLGLTPAFLALVRLYIREAKKSPNYK